MSRHTEGPWAFLPEECDKPYIRIRGTVLGGRYKICNVLTPVYDGVHDREALETRANARLIASAPKLLSVLEQIFRTGYTDFGDRIMVEDAIELATGRRPTNENCK